VLGEIKVEVTFLNYTEVRHSYGFGEYCCESFQTDTCENGGHCCEDTCRHYFIFCIKNLPDDLSTTSSCLRKLTTNVLDPNSALDGFTDDIKNPWTFEMTTSLFVRILYTVDFH